MNTPPRHLQHNKVGAIAEVRLLWQSHRGRAVTLSSPRGMLGNPHPQCANRWVRSVLLSMRGQKLNSQSLSHGNTPRFLTNLRTCLFRWPIHNQEQILLQTEGRTVPCVVPSPISSPGAASAFTLFVPHGHMSQTHKFRENSQGN